MTVYVLLLMLLAPVSGCTPGEMIDSATMVCVPCEPGTFQPANEPDIGMRCLYCPPGTAQPDPGQAECDTCMPPAILSTNDRTACKGSCPSGQFYDLEAAACTFCPIGTYADTANNEACTECPAGTTTLAKGSTSMTDCMTGCQPGEMIDQATMACLPCEPGTFQPQNAPGIAVRCMDCPPGTAQPDPGKAACGTCIPPATFSTDDRTACKEITKSTETLTPTLMMQTTTVSRDKIPTTSTKRSMERQASLPRSTPTLPIVHMSSSVIKPSVSPKRQAASTFHISSSPSALRTKIIFENSRRTTPVPMSSKSELITFMPTALPIVTTSAEIYSNIISNLVSPIHMYVKRTNNPTKDSFFGSQCKIAIVASVGALLFLLFCIVIIRAAFSKICNS